ncbi:MAG TPA: L-seryl-tRNA(Sec) selenium transferase [Gemmatimonadaceae bacterium]|nr:L-seryl-tRNA(Sec) selenium transferase [Gemmatimonadaceae bacterium]
MTDRRRNLPSVGALLETPGIARLAQRAPRPVLVAAVREVLARARRDDPGATADWCASVTAVLDALDRASLHSVLNGTGVVLHTNLGRAPLADTALTAITAVAAGYSNLELDLESGERGSRQVHCAAILRELTGAEDALVVNNGASALVLALNTLADGRDCIVSRGELVEIGGSFRIPDIMARSGARLVEVGTTNRTHLDDYRRALGPGTAAIVKVHRSNFSMDGFVADVPAAALAELAHAHHSALIHDLGSGLLMSLAAAGLTGEPTAADAVRGGATLVTMSGDKLLGGPQAGIVVGTRSAIAALRTNPLARALRVDKMTLAALAATLALYREPERALREIPVLAQLATSVADLRGRAARLVRALEVRRPAETGVVIEVVETEASVGGGAFPAARIPSVALAFTGGATTLERRLRLGSPSVLARIADDRVLIDLRTVAPRDDDLLATAVAAALTGGV